LYDVDVLVVVFSYPHLTPQWGHMSPIFELEETGLLHLPQLFETVVNV
jgi:hypothetical protein